jgi:hypothetical protein
MQKKKNACEKKNNNENGLIGNYAYVERFQNQNVRKQSREKRFRDEIGKLTQFGK